MVLTTNPLGAAPCVLFAVGVTVLAASACYECNTFQGCTGRADVIAASASSMYATGEVECTSPMVTIDLAIDVYEGGVRVIDGYADARTCHSSSRCYDEWYVYNLAPGRCYRSGTRWWVTDADGITTNGEVRSLQEYCTPPAAVLSAEAGVQTVARSPVGRPA